MISDYYIIPHEGINSIKLGMNKKIINKIMGTKPIIYDNIEIYKPLFTIRYKNNLVDMIMINNYTDIYDYNVILENINIFNLSYKDLIDFLTNIDKNIKIEKDKIYLEKLNIELLLNNKEVTGLKMYS